MRKCQPHLRYATTVFLNTRAIPIGSQYRAAHDKAMTGNEDNDTSVQPQPLWKDHAMGTARQDAGRQKPMALVRCQPPDDLPAKHPFCCSGVSRTNVRKTWIWGESIKIGSPLFFCIGWRHISKSKREKVDLWWTMLTTRQCSTKNEQWAEQLS